MRKEVIEDFMTFIDGKQGVLYTLDGLIYCRHGSEIVEFRDVGSFLNVYATFEYGDWGDIMNIVRNYARPYLLADTIDESHDMWRSMTDEIKSFKFLIARITIHEDSISKIEYESNNRINLHAKGEPKGGFTILLHN